MPHYTGTGPAYGTASVFAIGGRDYVQRYSDVGLTVRLRNPFVVVAGVYDFYTAVAAYIAFGVDRPIYENTDQAAAQVRPDRVAVDIDEYLAPKDYPF